MDLSETARVSGQVSWVLWGGDSLPFHVQEWGEQDNLITDYGHRMYWDRGAGVPSYPAAPSGMRLGSGTTPAAASGAGSHIDTYITGSARALTVAPSSVLDGARRRVTYLCTWPNGVGTGTITELVLTNEFPLTNIPGIDANTIARVVLNTPIVKGSSNGLSVMWHHEVGA